MSNYSITWDISDFLDKTEQVADDIKDIVSEAVGKAGDELLRLSSLEVPHDTGALQASGNVSKDELEATVSYDTPYAVRLHEHPEYRFQKGRKGKYLEDPLKNNINRFNQVIADSVKSQLI